MGSAYARNYEVFTCTTSNRQGASCFCPATGGYFSKKRSSSRRVDCPTTPITLIYKEWPGHGTVTPDDYRIVGTIEDLHNWIRNDEADFDFLFRTIIFGALSLCVGVFLALPD
jgi:hypothetical protein